MSAAPETPAPPAVAWALRRFPGAVVTATRVRPWAQVWSVDTAGERWWLKVNSAATAYEPRLLQLLAELGTSLSPAVQVHPQESWALVRDAGTAVVVVAREAGPAAVLDFWSGLLPRYAELQQAVPPERALAAGVPDASPAALSAVLVELLAEPEWLAREFAPQLADADRDRIRACGPALRTAVVALGDSLPAAVQHDDLHEGNVFVPDQTLDAARAVVIDWGDASLSHPFGTLLVTLGSLAAALGLAPDDPRLGRVRSAYLEVWRTRGESVAELDRQLDLALRTAPLVRAASWRRALGTPRAGIPLGMSEGVAGWLTRLADALAVG